MRKERKQEQALVEARQTVSHNFNSYAQTVELEFNEKTNTWVEQNIGSKIKEIDQEVAQLGSLQKQTNDEAKTYDDLLLNLRKFIDSVQRA